MAKDESKAPVVEKELLGTKDLMRMLNVNREIVLELTASGQLPKVEFPGLGRKILVRRADVEAFIASLPDNRRVLASV